MKPVKGLWNGKSQALQFFTAFYPVIALIGNFYLEINAFIKKKQVFLAD